MSFHFFVPRPGAPYRGLQLATCDQRGKMTPTVLPFADATTWSLQESAISEEEKEFVRRLNLFRSGVGNEWYCGISKYFLRCNEAPDLEFRILLLNSYYPSGTSYLKPPARKDSIVIPLTERAHQHTVPMADRLRILPILASPQNTQWFREGQNPFAPRPALLLPLGLPQPLPLALPLLPALPQQPQQQPLSTYIANTLVQHARNQPDAHCPITYDPLTECTQFCVGNCGHVYSNAAAVLQTCPLCTQRVTWTPVEITA